jgi:hypothetical protein
LYCKQKENHREQEKIKGQNLCNTSLPSVVYVADVTIEFTEKAPAAIPGCGNQPEDGLQSRLFSGESLYIINQLFPLREGAAG